MVVLAPIDQFRNTAYRVSEHNFDVICRELRRAKTILTTLVPASLIKTKTTPKFLTGGDLDSLVDQLEETKDELPVGQVPWTRLFEKLRFFPRFEHFVKIDILSQREPEFYKWKSYVET
jgi:hypothetical protein